MSVPRSGKRTALDGLERVEVQSRGELRHWLMRHHGQTESVWIVTYKKSAGTKYVPWPEVVEEALCFGWIDSLPRKLDDERSMILLSPRKSGSAWSAINKAKVEKLTAADLMAPAGLAKIAAAKADGSWSFLDDVEALKLPADLAAAFSTNKDARRNFDGFSRSSKRGILEWIKQARRPETRARRIAETVGLAAEGLRAAHPPDLRKWRT